MPGDEEANDRQPWYADVGDRAAGPRNPLVLISLAWAVAWIAAWLVFGAPLLFESPHAVPFICRGACGSIPPDQYRWAELYYGLFFGGFAALGPLSFLWKRWNISARDPPEEGRGVGPSHPSGWSICVECGGPLTTPIEQESGVCQGCRTLRN